ncbi:MAG: hypothetical protein WD509_01280 [Candidatus Paceibacterota bacterium]
MEHHAPTILEKQFDKLPKQLQAFISSGNLTRTLEDIGKDHTLSDREQTGLENTSLMILLGLEPLSELKNHLMQKYALTEEKAESVSDDFSAKVITPLEQDLRNFLENERQEEISNPMEESTVQPLLSKDDTDRVRALLRENAKTVSIKNIIANIE